MKKFFLLLMVSTWVFIADTHAQEYDDFCNEGPCCIDNNNFYAEILGGANFLQTTTDSGVKSNYRTGYIVAGTLGYRWCYGLRLEAEYAFRRNSLTKIHFFGRSFPIHGHFQSSSYMANVLWDLPLATWGYQCCGVHPFIGGGIGYDVQRVHGKNQDLVFNQKKRHFAWQVVAGIGYPLFCSTEISLEYKFHKGGLHYIYNHSLGLGLTYQFGL